jgi:hypothetical protein
VDSASTAAAFLAAIAVSDGLRLLPAGAIVVCRLAVGDWFVSWASADEHAGSRFRLVTWCSPVLLPVVAVLDTDTTPPLRRRVVRFRARLRRTRRYVAVLRVGGVAILAALIAGIPWLTARSGAWGLLLGISVVVLLCVMQTVIAIAAFRRTGAAFGRAAVASARYLWPFSAQRAAEDVLHRAAADVPQMILMHELLPPETFRRFARPILFDAVVRHDARHEADVLRSHIGEAMVADIVDRPPSDRDGDAYCPRCGTSFYQRSRFCSDCAEVELLPLIAG